MFEPLETSSDMLMGYLQIGARDMIFKCGWQ
jgi:hypothetical protein